MSVVHNKVYSRMSANASSEDQKRNFEKMMKTFRTKYLEVGGVKDRIEKYERYYKPSEKRRMRAKIERNRAIHRKNNNESN